MNNVYEQGLLGTGADLAARLLVPIYANVWVTNVLANGQQPRCYRLLGSAWDGPFFLFTFPPGRKFPYGLPVTPAS